jgi:hypothetical protein
LQEVKARLAALPAPARRDLAASAGQALILTNQEESPARQALAQWQQRYQQEGDRRYDTYLYSQSSRSALKVPEVKARYAENAPEVQGFELINAFFDLALGREPRLIAFGEDVGKLGDVNQGFRGLQEKYGELRVSDTGIREATIAGQAIGMALRGLRPLAEIQYLDYLLYSLQILSDDLASLHWRTAGGQKAPVIIRTRGHRLEGIWHSGSPMAVLLGGLRGIYLCVPRNMVQAVGMYNTLLQSDDPALVTTPCRWAAPTCCAPATT